MQLSDAKPYLCFDSKDEAFCVAVENVVKILHENCYLFTVPAMPDYLSGAVLFKGRVIPVVDVASRFGRGRSAITRRTSLVIVRIAQDGVREVGLLVDSVNGIADVTDNTVQPSPSVGRYACAALIRGTAKVDGVTATFLDIAHVLTRRELAAADRVANAVEQAMSSAIR